jgi:hypothetical protein
MPSFKIPDFNSAWTKKGFYKNQKEVSSKGSLCNLGFEPSSMLIKSGIYTGR